MSNDAENSIKLFGANNLLIQAALKSTQREIGLDFLPEKTSEPDKDATYYPQFSQEIRQQAAAMARHYEIFFCLETSIRQIIGQRLREDAGADWWQKKVPEVVRRNAENNKRKEIKAGVTPRSSDMLSYTNFGELGEIIKANWDVLGDMFLDINALESILARLNTLRGPIAHCCPLAEDEVVRLRLSLADWFRQMG